MVGDGQGATLVRFQRNLLREHNVARYEIALRYEAPSLAWSAITIELDDVRANAVLNAIPGAAITPNDLEIVVGIELPKLLR